MINIHGKERVISMIGIKNGMVLQRNHEDVCQAVIFSQQPIHSAQYAGACCGQAGITPGAQGQYVLKGIPIGGPYTLDIDGERFEDVWVGDVWILAGQSNMEGVGWLTPQDEAFTAVDPVRALYMTNEWGSAKHPLHDLGHAHFKVHAHLGGSPRPLFNSIGPGLSFGLEMHHLTSIPQGLLCCGHGGTTLDQWDPGLQVHGTDFSLYAAMAQRVKENGSHVRGMFWYQGCSDAEDQVHLAFTDHMKSFVDTLRGDFGKDLPIVQVQIGRTVTRPTPDYCLWWDSIKEQQRTLDQHIPNLYTICAITKELDDAIHISSAGQKELGHEGAQAMYHLLYGYNEKGCLPPPALDGISVETEEKSGLAILRLRYKHIHGKLVASGRPTGFEVRTGLDMVPPQKVFKITLEKDCALLHLTIPSQELPGLSLYYGRGEDPACNITDQANRAIPAMGPILL